MLDKGDPAVASVPAACRRGAATLMVVDENVHMGLELLVPMMLSSIGSARSWQRGLVAPCWETNYSPPGD